MAKEYKQMGWQVLGMLGLVGGGLILHQWTWLQRLDWWYPASAGHELWWIWWIGLYAGGSWWVHKHPTHRMGVGILWALTLIVAWSGFWNIASYIHSHFTVGDLHLNHFLGAQRAYRGATIYDGKGLFQSVNASPFVIALLRPFGGMSTREFLPWWLLLNGLFLSVYLAYGWAWIVRIGRRFAWTPGIAEFGLLVTTTLYFNSFQRSWRLGQLDTLLMALIAAGAYHIVRGWEETVKTPSSERPLSWHNWLGGILIALAIGVKLVPILLFLPLGLWWLVHAIRRTPHWHAHVIGIAVGAALAGSFVLSLSLAWVGPQELSRFVKNIPKMSQGSSAGVNQALVGRFAKYSNPKLRFRHAPLSRNALFWLWPLRIGVVLLLLGLAWTTAQTSGFSLFLMLGLMALPLVSPMCWDIYYLWCANFPWWLAFAWGVGMLRALPSIPKESQTPELRSQRLLLFAWIAVCILGSFYLMGLAGNSIIRDLRTLKIVSLELPMWFDESRMVGLGVLWVLVIALLQKERKRKAQEEVCPS